MCQFCLYLRIIILSSRFKKFLLNISIEKYLMNIWMEAKLTRDGELKAPNKVSFGRSLPKFWPLPAIWPSYHNVQQDIYIRIGPWMAMKNFKIVTGQEELKTSITTYINFFFSYPYSIVSFSIRKKKNKWLRNPANAWQVSVWLCKTLLDSQHFPLKNQDFSQNLLSSLNIHLNISL